MSAHTPGPWVAIVSPGRRYYEGKDITHYEVVSEKTRGELAEEGRTHYRPDAAKVDNVVVCGNTWWWDMAEDEAIANARLIAAAPELLEVLEEAMSMLGSRLIKDTLGYEWHEKASAAIAKAVQP